MKKIIAFTLIFVSFAAVNKTIAKVIVLTPSEYKQKLSSFESPQLLDVRTPSEYRSGHLQGAININIADDDFVTRASKLDKTKPVFVYCAAGVRSANAASKLSEANFTTIYDLRGGINRWGNEELPIVR